MDKIQPVILGGDVGAYALGLQCYEAFGASSICLANDPVDVITESPLFTVERIPPRASDKELLAVLLGIAAVYQHRELLLLTNSDATIGFVARHADQLSQHFSLPVPSEEAIDRLCRKDSFAQLCAELGVATPRTEVVDFADAQSGEWRPPTLDFTFPVVAKAASGEAYGKVSFPGKKKIWFIDDPEQLDALWADLRGAGFDDLFLVQELIPGDDTHVRSLTFYVDRSGNVALRAAAQVLLQDPSPTMIGNPVAMITREYPELWEQAERLLQAVSYRGFANFDIKVDPRNGTPYFFEVNPRIGRNSYYVAAAGQNPMLVMARDLVAHEDVTPVVADQTVLYSLVPLSLISRYVTESSLKDEAKELAAAGHLADPLVSPAEPSLKRKAIVQAQKLNYFRKFRRYYRVDL